MQRQIIDEIETAGVSYAVLWKFGWIDDVLDMIVAFRTSKIEGLGATVLDEYFRDNFEPVFQEGEYVVVRRKAL